MIVVDTNVVSEPIRRRPDLRIQAWLDHQPADALYFTTTSLSELLFGVELLPNGRRRTAVSEAITLSIERLFGARLLPFDERAASTYALLLGKARRAGMAIARADGQIAAIAVTHGFAVATRDTGPFIAAGVPVINPWQLAG